MCSTEIVAYGWEQGLVPLCKTRAAGQGGGWGTVDSPPLSLELPLQPQSSGSQKTERKGEGWAWNKAR